MKAEEFIIGAPRNSQDGRDFGTPAAACCREPPSSAVAGAARRSGQTEPRHARTISYILNYIILYYIILYCIILHHIMQDAFSKSSIREGGVVAEEALIQPSTDSENSSIQT